MKNIIIFISIFFTGCASIVKSRQQEVNFTSISPGKIQVKTPDGNITISQGSSSLPMNRSQQDIPVQIICPNGQSNIGTLKTHFDWAWGILGNLVSFQIIGWIVDPVSDKAYNIDDMNVSKYCN